MSLTSPRTIYLGHIAACLRRISKAVGYNTNAGTTVTLEPAPRLAEEKTPFVAVVWSGQVRATDAAMTRAARLTTVDIVARVPAAYTEAQAALDDIVQDIETALADQQYRYPRGYQFPQYQSAQPLPAAAADGWTGVVVTVAGYIPIH